MLALLLADLRYTLRLGRKSPGFFVSVILLFGLSIGLNCAIFSLLDALLLRHLPVSRPNELVRLAQVAAPLGARSFFRYTAYRDIAERAKSFTTVFAYSEDTVAMHDSTGVRNISCQIVSGSFFTALGVGPLYGRTLTVADEVHASDSLPAVLDYSFWNRNFAGDSGAVGKQFILQSRVFAIVGVMPRGF